MFTEKLIPSVKRYLCFLLLMLVIPLPQLTAQNFDINLLRNIHQHRNQALDPTFKGISSSVFAIELGTPMVIYSIGLLQKNKITQKQALFIAESFVVSTIFSLALKSAVGRDRPSTSYPHDIHPVVDVHDSSFPSGHSSNAFAFATALSLTYPKWYVMAPSFAWAGTVAYSRMHLGVHYPSDVLAGAAIGVGSAFLSREINKWLFPKNKK